MAERAPLRPQSSRESQRRTDPRRDGAGALHGRRRRRDERFGVRKWSAHDSGSIALGSMPSFDATIAGHVEDVALPFASVRRGQLTAHTFGSFEAPHVDVTFDADGVRIARYRFHRAHVAAAGPLTAERVTVSLRGDGEAVRAGATVVLGETPTVEHLQLDVSRGTRRSMPRGAREHSARRGLVAEAAITGIGEAVRGSLDAGANRSSYRQARKAWTCARWASLGFEDTLRSGRLAFAIDLSARRDRVDGSATVDLSGGCFGSLDQVSGHVDAKMTGRNVRGAMNVSGGRRGDARPVPGESRNRGKGPLDAGSWRRTRGELQVRGKIDLRQGRRSPPPRAAADFENRGSADGGGSPSTTR